MDAEERRGPSGIQSVLFSPLTVDGASGAAAVGGMTPVCLRAARPRGPGQGDIQRQTPRSPWETGVSGSSQGQGRPQRQASCLLLLQKQVGIAVRLTFETVERQKTSSGLTVVNNGTVAIWYDWRRQFQPDAFQDLKRDRTQQFYFNNREGTSGSGPTHRGAQQLTSSECPAPESSGPSPPPPPPFYFLCDGHLLTVPVCWGQEGEPPGRGSILGVQPHGNRPEAWEDQPRLFRGGGGFPISAHKASQPRNALLPGQTRTVGRPAGASVKWIPGGLGPSLLQACRRGAQ